MDQLCRLLQNISSASVWESRKKWYKIKYRNWMDSKGEKKLKTSHQASFPTLPLLKVPPSGHSLVSLCKEIKQADLFLSWSQLEVPHLYYLVLLPFSWRAASELPHWEWSLGIAKSHFHSGVVWETSLRRSEACEGLSNYLTIKIASLCAVAGYWYRHAIC